MKLWDCRRVLSEIRKVAQQSVAWSCVQLHGHRQRGVTLGLDIRRSLIEQPSIIFDVGAHHGESIDEFKAWFPKAIIHCFEPAHEAFTILRRRTNSNPRVICYNSALSEARGKATIHIRRGTDNSSLTDYTGQHELEDIVRKEEVTVDTIDDHASAHGVERIDFLKIDTEGLDLKVLLGARAMFNARSIGIVQVEAAMCPENAKHVPYQEFENFFGDYRYRLFGIYDQVGEWPTSRPFLRRSNLVFISPEIARI